ncbi:hypothetical protein [Streptomyces sp. NPDC002540]
MLLTQPGHDLQLLRWLDHLGLRLQVVGAAFLSGRWFGQAGAMGVDRFLDRLAKIGPQVVAVCDLLGLRRLELLHTMPPVGAARRAPS